MGRIQVSAWFWMRKEISTAQPRKLHLDGETSLKLRRKFLTEFSALADKKMRG